MLKKLMMTASTAALLALGAGSAQSAEQAITISATVTGFCTITGAESTASIPAINDGEVVPTLIPISLGTVVCNKKSTVSLKTANGGVLSATTAANFANRIDYTATVSAPAAVSLTTNGVANATATSLPAASTGPYSGSAGVDVTTIDPVLPLVAATDYTDTLTVTILPQA